MAALGHTEPQRNVLVIDHQDVREVDVEDRGKYSKQAGALFYEFNLIPPNVRSTSPIKSYAVVAINFNVGTTQ